jgi:hypothetical protein
MSSSEVEELRKRLALAEQVCKMVGITAVSFESDREMALTQAWMEWSKSLPSDYDIRPSDEKVLELASERRRIRAETLARLGVGVGA